MPVTDDEFRSFTRNSSSVTGIPFYLSQQISPHTHSDQISKLAYFLAREPHERPHLCWTASSTPGPRTLCSTRRQSSSARLRAHASKHAGSDGVRELATPSKTPSAKTPNSPEEKVHKIPKLHMRAANRSDYASSARPGEISVLPGPLLRV